MGNAWRQILDEQAREKGNATVARELGVSPTTICLVRGGKYQAATSNIEKKVMGIYGASGMVDCPVLGVILPDRCATNWERANKIGMKAGNPRTIKLYKTCLKCDLRNG